MPLPLLLLLLGIGSAGVDDPLPSDPVFEVRRLDGSTWTGRLAELDLQSSARIVETSGTERFTPFDELFALTRADSAAELARRREGALLLAGGDVLLGQVLQSDGEVVSIRSSGGATSEVELDRVEGVLMSGLATRELRDTLIDTVRADPRDSDAFWLSNGDRLTGTFGGLDGEHLRFEREGQPAELPRGQVTAIGLDPTLVRGPEAIGRAVEVHTRSGGRLTATDVRLVDGQLRLTLATGPIVEVPQGEVDRIYARSPAFEFLTERPIDGQESVPYVGPALMARINRGVRGGALVVGDRVVPRGIGVHSRSLLAYRLGSEDRRFQAEVAVADSASAWGSIVFRVLLDAKPAFESGVVRRGDPPIPINLDVRGKSILILVAEFGPTGGTQDEGVWLEPRLVK